MAKKPAHIFVRSADTGCQLSCANCGERRLIGLPVAISIMRDWLLFFERAHRRCAGGDEGEGKPKRLKLSDTESITIEEPNEHS